jgi:hypothetical protein
MAKQTNTSVFKVAPKVKRKGVHAKTKMSVSKSSKNYVKLYKGQGK